MRDPQTPAPLRVQVARAAAPLVHAKPGTSSKPLLAAESACTTAKGHAIDLEVARTLRDLSRRVAVFMRKRYAPKQNGGPMTPAEIAEEAALGERLSEIAGTLTCPPHRDSWNDKGLGIAEALDVCS